MTVKVSHNKETGLVIGNYPDSFAYAIIPEPYIEVTDEEHKFLYSQGKEMKVVGGALVEVVPTTKEQLQQARKAKILEISAIRQTKQYENITHNDITLIASDRARDNLFKGALITSNLGQENINWLDINNNPITLTLVDANAILALLMERDSVLYHREAELTLKIGKLTSIKSIEGINF